MDLAVFLTSVAGDPLVLVLALFVVLGLLTHFVFGKHPLRRAIARVGVLILLTVTLLRADIVPYERLQLTGSPFHDAVHAALKIAWWLWTAWFVVGFLRAFVIVEHRPREGKLLQDLLAGLVYLAAVFAIISYVFDRPIQGLLATSGAIAIVLGLALQSTLSDLFSGIVLNFSRPYRPGDWISIEGGTDGQVIEMNWRATHILTGRRDLAIVPNSTIAKSRIVNASSPSGVHGSTITIQLETRTQPLAAIETLQRAALNCLLIVSAPAPLIAVKSINAAFAEFEVTFYVEELASTTRAQNQLFDMIYRHVAASGLELVPPQTPFSASGNDEKTREPRPLVEIALDLVTIFATLTASERAAIAAKLTQDFFDQGDVLIEAGRVMDHLCIVASGVISYTRRGDKPEAEFLRLGPGDHFGEVSLLTGAPGIATVRALTPVIVYKLAKADLAPILEARPEVSQELSRALARRQAAGRSAATTETDEAVPTNRLTTWFSDRIHRLYVDTNDT